MYNQSKHKERKHFCMYCLQCSSSKDVLEKHIESCLIINGKQAIKMPEKDNNVLKYNNFYKQLPVPFVIYTDFEDNNSYTEAYQTHSDCGYAYKLVCCFDDKYSRPVQIYRGQNAVCKLEKMLYEVNYCKKIMRNIFNKPLKTTDDDELCFKLMDKCHICGKKYTDKDVRVRDHCHITGKFRGSAHRERNMKLRITPESIKIPVAFHNLHGYD